MFLSLTLVVIPPIPTVASQLENPLYTLGRATLTFLSEVHGAGVCVR